MSREQLSQIYLDTALGCRVFKNPPLVIIDIFNICLRKLYFL